MRSCFPQFIPLCAVPFFRMGFDVRPYTDGELEEMFITVPGCLSQYEMYRLAQQYAEQGKNTGKHIQEGL